MPFLSQFVNTAEAPTYLLDAFNELVEGPGTQGSLADVSSSLVVGAWLLVPGLVVGAAAILLTLPMMRVGRLASVNSRRFSLAGGAG